ncbi:alanine--tRNA ligase [Allohahella marinimesophila]|uniref:Alanine--tRNA ligase n=1 Tax=Allohahella marinimesophila TaxID=1054972 RepID=A0ABP7PPY8_9GAMM
MKTTELRQSFLDYFAARQHEVVSSSSLVPAEDPTLLFTNAGMNQFKDLFLGREKRSYNRAASAQKCVRAGGKHNDLDNVGYTARHHTFFEMLGNFSFGDYFKEDAIAFAWEFLTSKEWLGLSADRLTVTVYSEDDESFAIWRDKIGVPEARIIRIGDKGERYESDNFWQMGDTGPCGPCTEVFYDHGADIPGGPPGSPEEDGDRFIEIWNVVFMQFNRQADGTMEPLPKPSVDTGMGLERVAAVLQDVHSNYEIDLFVNLLTAAARLLKQENNSITAEVDELVGQASMRVIADHIRSCAFLIADGITPSNENRGFVLRRIIRRAVRHGHKLGFSEGFFSRLVKPLVLEMGTAYPELQRGEEMISRILANEEAQFSRTLDKGLRLLEAEIERLDSSLIPGKTVFTLYDTYGFPLDLTNDIARERGLELDKTGFEEEMEVQRQRARAASSFNTDYSAAAEGEATSFVGYESLHTQASIKAIICDGERISVADADTDCDLQIILDQTPFYSESGGQIGDCGFMESNDGSLFEVRDTRRLQDSVLHLGVVLKGAFRVDSVVTARVDGSLRSATAANHSATHLLHAALRKVLGEHVQQKGSLVNSERLRFDFTHFESISDEELTAVNHMVNSQIRANTPVHTEEMSIAAARSRGAMALFGEKYGEQVRVLEMGETDERGAPFSIELCGGTHVRRTGDIGHLIITSESAIASGVRRVEAVTGAGADRHAAEALASLRAAAGLLKTSPDKVCEQLSTVMDRQKALEKQLGQLKSQAASQAGDDLLAQAKKHGDISYLMASIDGADRKTLMETADQLKNKLGQGVVVLASEDDGAMALVAGVTKALSATVKAGDVIKQMTAVMGGKGGGRPDMAQGGGGDSAKLDEAFAAVEAWLKQQISE